MITLQQSIWKLTDNRSLTSTATYIRKKSRGIAWWFPLLVQFSCRRKACYFKSRFLQNNCSLGEVQARTDKDIYCVCILCSLKQEGIVYLPCAGLTDIWTALYKLLLFGFFKIYSFSHRSRLLIIIHPLSGSLLNTYLT